MPHIQSSVKSTVSLPEGLTANTQKVADGENRTESRRSVVTLTAVDRSNRADGEISHYLSMPPPPDTHLTSLKQAEDALNRVFQRLAEAAASSTAPSASAPVLPRVGLGQLEAMSMEDIMRVSSLLVMSSASTVATLKGELLEIRTTAQENLRTEEVKKIQEQVDKGIEDAQKAKKAGIFSVILDWAIAAAEVISGAFKLIGGIVTANPIAIAGGMADLSAGVAGLGKAIFATLALADPKHAEKYQKVADYFGKVQLACEVVGMAIDITNLARGLKAGRQVGKAAATALESGGGEALKAAMQTGEKAAVESVVKATAQHIADEAATQVLKQLAKEIGSSMAPEAGKRLLQQFSQEAIQTLVERSLQAVVTQAIEKGAGHIARTTAEKLSEQIVKDINRQMARAVLKASVTVVNVARTAAAAGGKLGGGVINKERAELQQEIQLLIADQQWMQLFYQMYEESKKDSTEQLQSILAQQTQAVQALSDASNATNRLLINNITSAQV